MTKILTTAMAIFYVFSLSAAETVVSVTPTRPAKCNLRDYALINMVYELEKEETSKEVAITFKTSIGTCKNNKITTFKYMGYQNINMFNEGITYPWSYLPKVETVLVSENIVKVSLFFDKTKIFKNKSSRKMQFTFAPGDFEGADSIITKIYEEFNKTRSIEQRNLSIHDYKNNLNFIWNLNLIYDRNQDITSLKFKHK